jgi:hypothetical protein
VPTRLFNALQLIAGRTYSHRPGAVKSKPRNMRPAAQIDDSEAVLTAGTVKCGGLADAGGNLSFKSVPPLPDNLREVLSTHLTSLQNPDQVILRDRRVGEQIWEVIAPYRVAPDGIDKIGLV